MRPRSPATYKNPRTASKPVERLYSATEALLLFLFRKKGKQLFQKFALPVRGNDLGSGALKIRRLAAARKDELFPHVQGIDGVAHERENDGVQLLCFLFGQDAV